MRHSVPSPTFPNGWLQQKAQTQEVSSKKGGQRSYHHSHKTAGSHASTSQWKKINKARHQETRETGRNDRPSETCFGWTSAQNAWCGSKARVALSGSTSAWWTPVEFDTVDKRISRWHPTAQAAWTGLGSQEVWTFLKRLMQPGTSAPRSHHLLLMNHWKSYPSLCRAQDQERYQHMGHMLWKWTHTHCMLHPSVAAPRKHGALCNDNQHLRPCQYYKYNNKLLTHVINLYTQLLQALPSLFTIFYKYMGLKLCLLHYLKPRRK